MDNASPAGSWTPHPAKDEPLRTLPFTARILLAATLAVQPSLVLAQDPQGAANRLGRLVEAAWRHAPEVQASLARVRADAADARQAGAPAMPWLEVDARDTRWLGEAADGMRRIRLGLPFRYPWQWPGQWALLREVEAWQEASERAVRLEVAEAIARAWIDLAAARAATGVAHRLTDRQQVVFEVERTRIEQGLAPPVERVLMEVERARSAARLRKAQVDEAEAAGEVAWLAGEPAEVTEEDLLDLVAATRTPEGAPSVLVERMRSGAAFRAVEALSNRNREEGRTRMADAMGTPRLEIGIRQERDADLVSPDLSAVVGLRVPIPAGRGVRQERIEGAARVAEAEHDRTARLAEHEARLSSALATARASEDWLSSFGHVLDGLTGAEAALASRHRLRETSGADYLRDLDRLARVRLEILDAARTLLAARLELAVLLEDPQAFPPLFGRTLAP
ncbi:MAG: TolC family protein [Deltaproteobacteria bacterium]|nr:TolC family protein [Deltaproteobacteria bacterium]